MLVHGRNCRAYCSIEVPRIGLALKRLAGCGRQGSLAALVGVATPGRTATHASGLAHDGAVSLFRAGDTSCNEDLMLAGEVDGVSRR